MTAGFMEVETCWDLFNGFVLNIRRKCESILFHLPLWFNASYVFGQWECQNWTQEPGI